MLEVKVKTTDTTEKAEVEVEVDTIKDLLSNTTIRTKRVEISNNTRRRSLKTTDRNNKMKRKERKFKKVTMGPNYKSKHRTDLQQWKMIFD